MELARLQQIGIIDRIIDAAEDGDIMAEVKVLLAKLQSLTDSPGSVGSFFLFLQTGQGFKAYAYLLSF